MVPDDRVPNGGGGSSGKWWRVLPVDVAANWGSPPWSNDRKNNRFFSQKQTKNEDGIRGRGKKRRRSGTFVETTLPKNQRPQRGDLFGNQTPRVCARSMSLPMKPIWKGLAERKLFRPIRGLRSRGRGPTAHAMGCGLSRLSALALDHVGSLANVTAPGCLASPDGSSKMG